MSQPRTTSIRNRLMLINAIFGAGFVALIALSFFGLARLNQARNVIAGAKDLIADTVPPDANLSESWMLVLHLATESDPAERRMHRQRLEAKKAVFFELLDTWRTRLADDPELRAQVERFESDGKNFFDAVDRDFMPVAMAGDHEAAARAVHGPLQDVYDPYAARMGEFLELVKRKHDSAAAAYRSTLAAMKWLSLIIGVFVTLVCGWIGLRMSNDIAHRLADVRSVLGEIAGGDLTQEVRVRGSDEIARMAESVNEVVRSTRTALIAVTEASSGVRSSSQELSSEVARISHDTQEQASSLEETSASMEELTATVRQNSDSANEANQLAAGAREVAERGGRVVGEAVAAMSQITERSKAIAQIVTAIDEIAFQTNLLALNAAVEAARAGEQGRGFAVVATEVRNLAQRSAQSAKEIGELIQSSVRQIEDGTRLVNDSGATLEEIVTSVKRLTDIVAEIAAASREQANGITQVNSAVAQMDRLTQSNASKSDHLASTSVALATEAGRLQSLVEQFRLGEALRDARDAEAFAQAA